MNAATYTRYEIVRAFRNRRFFMFSLVFPLLLYFLTAGPNQGTKGLFGYLIPVATDQVQGNQQ